MEQYELQAGDILVIGPTELMVVGVREDRVRLGFVAPREIRIYRKELYLEIHKSKPPADPSGPGEGKEPQ